MKDKLRVGIIGVGGIGFDQHLPGWLKVPLAEIVAGADVSLVALDRAKTRFSIPHVFQDWRDLVAMEELDVVDICTPNRMHGPMTLAALEAGKHVLCEKPLATSSAEVRAIITAAEKAGKLVMSAQNLRFESASMELKRMADAGTFGEIYYARAQWLRRRMLPPRPTFIEKRLSGGGPIFDLGVHILDLAYWLMGAPKPVSVSAVATDKLAHRSDLSSVWGEWERDKYDVEDFAAGFVRFENGTSMTLETSWLAFQAEPALRRLQFFGTSAGAIWPDGIIVGETNNSPWTMQLDDLPKTSSHHAEIASFAKAIEAGSPSPVALADSLAVIQILEAFYRSSELKKEVPVE